MQNFMKTIINAVQSWTKKEIKDSTADWNQNDASANNYVKNRTHWEEEDGTVHKLDSKYLNLPTNIATTDDVQEAVDVANAAQSTADTAVANAATAQSTADTAVANAATAQSTANSKMDATNPVGTGSFSMNRQVNSIVGKYSAVMGQGGIGRYRSQTILGEYNENDAEYFVSAEALNTTAVVFSKSDFYYYSTDYELDKRTGIFTLINPQRIVGSELHSMDASGFYFIRGDYSNIYKIEPDTISGSEAIRIPSGLSSTIHGSSDKLYRYVRHIAVVLNSKGSAARGTYAHIVGNGTSDTARSNAHTLDWNGVGWFQGGLQIGGNAQDDGAKNVLVEGDAIPVPSTAQVGQILSVKAIDENGNPTEWETIDNSFNTNGIELVDRTTGSKYNVYVDNGKLTMEVI